MFVMDTSESFASNFVDFIEVMQIGGCVIFTTIAVAFWIDRRELFAIFGITDIDATIWSIECAVASLASWSDAIESIAAIHGTNK